MATVVDNVHGVVIVDQDPVVVKAVSIAKVPAVGPWAFRRRSSVNPCLVEIYAANPVPSLVAFAITQAGRPRTTSVAALAGVGKIIA